MAFEKEVRFLRNLENLKHHNPNEWEVIQDMCYSLERNDITGFNQCYYSYYSIARNTNKHNKDGFNVAKDLFYKLNPKFSK